MRKEKDKPGVFGLWLAAGRASKPDLGHLRGPYIKIHKKKNGEGLLGLEEFAEEGGGVFAEGTVGGTEGRGKVGVDVEFADDFAADEDGNDDFRFGFEGAGEVAGV